ncbi:MAG: lipase [Candidatus Nephthysia bennettiae]|uniref:Alpha/beta hydrolase n=1 Tax=Candidatus Nephthysia bennettiae TaxID=3127016 RepID=A0A934K7T9_9BACT|nr:alpha/beta hydrolase [Candidatus Dormibacteraeota bacterium]MBJ7610854.1 alpha/beta hydrolase [Candidatus Dormibacteraeota bacterium]PZR90374.1 MAG: lipase [Candidatus Dormibacteraeota bacterium]
MTLDPQARRHLDEMDKLGQRPVQELSPEAARAQSEANAAALAGESEEMASTADLEVAGVRIRYYVPAGSNAQGADLPLVVFIHGGGWVVGSLDTYDGVCRALANRVPCRVVSVDYRLAPEHPFPAAVEDSWAVTRWAFEQSDRVAVAGDSAGGNLAAVMALRARDAGLPLAFQLLIYPVTDHSFDTASYSANASGFGLTQLGMRWYWDQYLGSSDGAHPEASPLRAKELSGAAPALVVVCEYDPLRDEGVAYAERLEAAGVPVRLSEYEGMIHGFFRLGSVMDRAHDVIDESALALREALSGQ